MEYEELERDRDAWREAHNRAVHMATVLAEALEDAMQQEGIWFGDHEVVRQIMMDLGVGNYG